MEEGMNKSILEDVHPWTCFLYFVLVIGCAMVSLSPVYLLVTAVFSRLLSYRLEGRAGAVRDLRVSVPVYFLMSVLNLLFTHKGNTVLVHAFGQVLTLEALLYGLAAATLLSSVIIWFLNMGILFSQEKLVALFSRHARVLGLTFSMIFRYIPLLRRRSEAIREGQRCLGRTGGGPVTAFRQFGKSLSILLSWSLESSLETADAMTARGYGLPGRTSFQLFRFRRTDGLLCLAFAGAGALVLAGILTGSYRALYYPVLQLAPGGSLGPAAAVTYLGLTGAALLPPLGRGELIRKEEA